MKHDKRAAILFFLIHLFLPTLYVVAAIPIDMHKTALVVVLMVKDEAEVIIPTLQPFIDGGIDSYLIYDTGSTDRTPDIVRAYFKENGITHGHVVEESFVDFATSRNRGLDLAEQIFPYASFMVMSDAEWYIHNAHDLLQFCENHKDGDSLPKEAGGAYLIRLFTLNDSMEHFTARLLRCKAGARFIGVVHEVINRQATTTIPLNIYFEYAPQSRGIDKSKKRWEQDCILLHKHLDQNPGDSRTLFYLAQTYQFLNDWHNAIEYYRKRAHVNEGFSEERYMALYRIGCAIEYLLETEEMTDYTWDDALYYYLKAHGMRPHRAEPLVRIALHYLMNDEKEIAFLFANRAAELPFPLLDGLFVEKKMYEFYRYDIVGQCALSVGEFEIGKNALLKALKVAPTLSHLHHNLGLYLQYITL